MTDDHGVDGAEDGAGVNQQRRLCLGRPFAIIGAFGITIAWPVITALAWALKHPGTVARVVLLSGYYYPSARVDAAMLGIAEMPLVRPVFENAIAPLQTRLTGPAGVKMVFAPAETSKKFVDEMPFGLMLRPGQIAA